VIAKPLVTLSDNFASGLIDDRLVVPIVGVVDAPLHSVPPLTQAEVLHPDGKFCLPPLAGARRRVLRLPAEEIPALNVIFDGHDNVEVGGPTSFIGARSSGPRGVDARTDPFDAAAAAPIDGMAKGHPTIFTDSMAGRGSSFRPRADVGCANREYGPSGM
jgi:hypothetical protein